MAVAHVMTQKRAGSARRSAAVERGTPSQDRAAHGTDAGMDAVGPEKLREHHCAQQPRVVEGGRHPGRSRWLASNWALEEGTSDVGMCAWERTRMAGGSPAGARARAQWWSFSRRGVVAHSGRRRKRPEWRWRSRPRQAKAALPPV